jgi:hypothetical protein
MTTPALISPSEWSQAVQAYHWAPNNFLSAYRWVTHHPVLYNNKHYVDHSPVNAQLDRLQLNFSMDSGRNLTYHFRPLVGNTPTLNPALNSEGDSYETAIIDLGKKLREQYGPDPKPTPDPTLQPETPDEPYTVLM